MDPTLDRGQEREREEDRSAAPALAVAAARPLPQTPPPDPNTDADPNTNTPNADPYPNTNTPYPDPIASTPIVPTASTARSSCCRADVQTDDQLSCHRVSPVGPSHATASPPLRSYAQVNSAFHRFLQ